MWNNEYDNDSSWSRNYRIPKRKLDQTSNEKFNLANPAINGPSYGYYDQSGQSQWQQEAYSHYQSKNPAEPITQNICNALSNIKEKPKNHQKNIFKETVPDIEDETLPKELTAMFQPLYCKLCSAQLSSNVMAKLHYKSKKHEKKIRKFLIEHSERTGEPLHKRANIPADVTKSEEDQNPKWFHCDVCDLPLTGKLHAESHYMGRNHHKALMGYKAPAGKGFYNNEGKWVRQSSKKSVKAEGQDTFGICFMSKPTTVLDPVSTATATASVSMGPAPPKPPVAPVVNKFECSVCDIWTTSQEQLDIHCRGQKHHKKLKALGMVTEVPQVSGCQPAPATNTKQLDNINLSVYRTPSGDFYCPQCNITLNCEIQFVLHLKSKGHMKKISQK